MFPNPDAQDILLTVHLNPKYNISPLGYILIVLFYLVVDGIHEYKQINLIQRTVLSGISRKLSKSYSRYPTNFFANLYI